MTKDVLYKIQKEWGYYAAVILAVICANAVIYAFTGNYPSVKNVYNSYALQTEAWLDGRLDLGRNYPHLEIAVFENKYFVSFPPFPSVLLLPFAAILRLPFLKGLGLYTPDHLITLFMACIAAVYAYRLARVFTEDKSKALFYSLFLCIGSNFLFLSNTGFVWFMAQVFAFSFTIMAFYYACRKNHIGKANPALSLLFMCCALGCRPLNAVYLPVILYFLYIGRSEKNFLHFAGKLIVYAVPAVLLGCLYMALNYLRFGNVIEFGHNYLPEFTEAPLGQFNKAYLPENFMTLWRLPEFVDGKIKFQKFNGTAFWLVSPIAITYAVTYFRELSYFFMKRKKSENAVFLLLPIFLTAHLLILCMHKTMGGWHFGHRYTVDMLPTLFLGLVWQDRCGKWAERFSIPLLAGGMGLNIIGTVLLYLGYL